MKRLTLLLIILAVTIVYGGYLYNKNVKTVEKATTEVSTPEFTDRAITPTERLELKSNLASHLETGTLTLGETKAGIFDFNNVANDLTNAREAYSGVLLFIPEFGATAGGQLLSIITIMRSDGEVVASRASSILCPPDCWKRSVVTKN